MTHDEFDKLFEAQVERSRSVLVQKSKEYSTEDKLHNFKVAAAVQGITPLEALAGMMAKHTVSVYDILRIKGPVNPDMFDEKITDHINYLILAKALFEEAQPVADIGPTAILGPSETLQRVTFKDLGPDSYFTHNEFRTDI